MRILIDGYHVNNWAEVAISMRMLTLGMLEAFRRLPHAIEIETVFSPDRRNVTLPQVDGVLLIDFYTPNVQEDLRSGWLRQQTGAKQLVSLCEGSFFEADHCFIFDEEFTLNPLLEDQRSKFSYVPLPYMPQLMQPTPKVAKTVLFDYKTNFAYDWTDKIFEWSAELPADYQVARIHNDNQMLHPHENSLQRRNYPAYLRATSYFERFVVTESETYGFSVIDMAARGTEVFAPATYLRPCLVRDLNVKVFHSKEELLDLLQRPYEQPPLPPDGYTSYDQLAEMIYQHFLKHVA